MELKTIAECDKELDYLDKMQGSFRWFLEHSEGQLKYYRHLVEEYNRQIFNNRVEYEKVELRKKELCNTTQMVSESNNANSSLFQNVGAVVEDYVNEIQSSTNVSQLKTLND